LFAIDAEGLNFTWKCSSHFGFLFTGVDMMVECGAYARE
jgi:hypothetical protein